MKTPTAVEHDELGRLVAVRFDSVLPLPGAPFERWLIGVDGSEHSLKAVAHAVKFAGVVHGLALDLIDVVHWRSKEAAEELPALGLEETRAAREIMDAAGVPWRLHVVMGETAATVVSRAEALGANAIVLGSHGQGGFKAMLLGSVAMEVLHRASVPVWIVR